MDFTNKQVVITGGLGSLGRVVVKGLVESGAMCYIPEFVTKPPSNFPYRKDSRVRLETGIDLSEEQSVVDFYAAIPELWASIHLTGGFHMGLLEETSKDVFMRQLTLNTVTCFLCCREAVRSMKGAGRIVNVVSRQALEPRLGSGTCAYTASKGAVYALTQALAEEVAGRGIWVNAIAPSILDTPLNRASMPKADHALWPSVEEVASTVLFLASTDNKVSRGAIVPVYGKI